MSATYLFTLSPSSGFSSSGREEEAGRGFRVHSDTLAAALRCVAMETGVLAEAFQGPSPPFRVSSVFPQVSGVRLYPRPMPAPGFLEGGADGEEAPGGLRRVWDSLQFVTEARLESLAEGRRVRLEREDVVEGTVWGMPSERGLGSLPRALPLTRVAVDRAGGGAERFVRGRVAFPEGTRLFFLARVEEPALLAPFKDLVRLLGEAGLGGERASGAGHFELTGAHPAPALFSEPPVGEDALVPLLLLSLYLPTREEVARGILEGAAAELLVRGGWIYSGGPSGFRKRSLRMLLEGTVIPEPHGPLQGEVRDVAPERFDRHPVWRDGRAFAIPYRGAR